MTNFIPEDYTPTDRLYLSLILYTFESLIQQPNLIIGFIESAFEIANPFEMDLQIVVNPDAKEGLRQPLTPDSWNTVKERLRQGRVRLLLSHRRQHLPPLMLTPHWSAQIQPNETLHRVPKYNAQGFLQLPVPNTLEIVVEFPKEVRQVDHGIQQVLSHLGREQFVYLHAIYGLITLGTEPSIGTTVYEKTFGVQPNWIKGLLQRIVRGAFWENYLSSQHIQMLGGVEEIIRTAPVADVAILEHGLALRLAGDINDISAEQRQELEHFLRPLAPLMDLIKASGTGK